MSTRRGARALLVSIVLLFALAGTMGWLVGVGITRGETKPPMKQSSLRRTVSRVNDPGMYWFSISAYAAVCAGALVLGVLGMREGRRLSR